LILECHIQDEKVFLKMRKEIQRVVCEENEKEEDSPDDEGAKSSGVLQVHKDDNTRCEEDREESAALLPEASPIDSAGKLEKVLVEKIRVNNNEKNIIEDYLNGLFGAHKTKEIVKIIQKTVKLYYCINK
jgi:hypothetical protein